MTQHGAPPAPSNSGEEAFGFHLEPRIDGLDPRWTDDSFSLPDVADAYCHALDSLKVIFARFWTPVQLFALGAVQQWRMHECLDWLRPVELMLRRIIFIEAQGRAKDLPAPRPLKPKRPHRPRSRLDPSFDAANSQTRRVSFANLRPVQSGRPSGPYKPKPARAAWEAPLRKPCEHGRMLNPLPLAYRLEAIVRVCADPWPRIAPRRPHEARHRPARCGTRRPQPMRIPRTLPTLNRLAAIMGLRILRRRDSS